MLKFSRGGFSLLMLLAYMSLLGCSYRPGPRSAYQTLYQNRLAEIKLPSFEEIASTDDSLSETFHQPAHKVWDTCLHLATQSKGVLGAADDESGGHRLLLIAGETLEYKRDRRALVDRWLVISVRPLSEASTEVRIAFLSPKSSHPAPFFTDMLPDGFKGDKQRSISRRAAEAFMLALNKTFSEDEYLSRFKRTSRPTARGIPRHIETNYAEKGEAIAQQQANHNSANIRRESLILKVPQLEATIAEIINDIASAAGQSERVTHVFIVATLVPNVQIEPNGDLFITTSALDNIQNLDELAGILSHELAHIFLRHGSLRVGAFRRAGASRNTITLVLMIAGAAAGVMSLVPDSASPEDTILDNQEVLVGAAVYPLAYYYLPTQLGIGIGKGVGGFTIHRFTRKQELEADDYGAELLWAAGYNYRGLLNLLRREGDGKLFDTTGGKER